MLSTNNELRVIDNVNAEKSNHYAAYRKVEYAEHKAEQYQKYQYHHCEGADEATEDCEISLGCAGIECQRKEHSQCTSK